MINMKSIVLSLPCAFLSAVLTILSTTHSYALSNVRYLDYQYKSDVATYPEKNTFVICDNCPARRHLEPMPQRQLLTIKMGESSNPVPSPVVSAPAPQKIEPVQPKITMAKTEAKKECLRGTVYFDLGKAKLPHKEIKKLKEVATEGLGLQLDVYGYTCDLGSQALNDKLSLKRAKYVASLLSKEGAEIGRVEGKGKCCYAAANRSLNRRAEIIYMGEMCGNENEKKK